MFSLNEKVALVTGGGSGIGRAVSLLFAQQGASVFILDIDEAGAIETTEMITTASGHGVFKECSVAVKEDVDAVVQSNFLATGRLDVVVNNAGIAHIGNAENTTPDDVERLLSVNVKGVYHVMQAALPHLKNGAVLF